MSRELKIQEFDNKQVRIVWDDEEQKYYFSVTDVVQVLTEQPNARGASTYWAVLKKRLKQEGASELLTNCKQLKLPATDGKNRATDVADIEQLLRIIQSIPSKKAEPLKRWLAQVGSARIDQLQDPELSIEQAINDYRRLGYGENWINQRVKSIETRNAKNFLLTKILINENIEGTYKKIALRSDFFCVCQKKVVPLQVET